MAGFLKRPLYPLHSVVLNGHSSNDSTIFSVSQRGLLQTAQLKSYLVGGFNPKEKYAQVKLDHFPKDRGEKKKYLKPPPKNPTHWFRCCTQKRNTTAAPEKGWM